MKRSRSAKACLKVSARLRLRLAGWRKGQRAARLQLQLSPSLLSAKARQLRRCCCSVDYRAFPPRRSSFFFSFSHELLAFAVVFLRLEYQLRPLQQTDNSVNSCSAASPPCAVGHAEATATVLLADSVLRLVRLRAPLGGLPSRQLFLSVSSPGIQSVWRSRWCRSRGGSKRSAPVSLKPLTFLSDVVWSLDPVWLFRFGLV
ncbi:hypothetical protein AOLI_G00251080 [Acnodon oligacanthus]